MRKLLLGIVLLTMVLLLAGCAAPHVRAQGDAASDVIILRRPEGDKGREAVVTLKPVPTATPTPAVTPMPTATPTPAPTPSPAPEEPKIEEPDRSQGQKYVYLTFDDGPSKNTQGILKVLDEKGVHATFFVIGNNAANRPDDVRAIAAQGSIVAVHSMTHETDKIYVSAEAFLEDVAACQDTLREILGADYQPEDLIRFPYGSTNRRCRDYRDDVRAAGYRYFDWNALNGDAESGASQKSAEELYERFVETVDIQAKRGRDIIVLMHDTNSKTATVEMLPDAIDYLKDLGYTFATLESVPMEE